MALVLAVTGAGVGLFEVLSGFLIAAGFAFTFAPGSKFSFKILSTKYFGLDMLSVIYFSIIRLAMGAAHVEPCPPFSTITAIAILGLFLGAKAKNTE